MLRYIRMGVRFIFMKQALASGARGITRCRYAFGAVTGDCPYVRKDKACRVGSAVLEVDKVAAPFMGAFGRRLKACCYLAMTSRWLVKKHPTQAGSLWYFCGFRIRLRGSANAAPTSSAMMKKNICRDIILISAWIWLRLCH